MRPFPACMDRLGLDIGVPLAEGLRRKMAAPVRSETVTSPTGDRAITTTYYPRFTVVEDSEMGKDVRPCAYLDAASDPDPLLEAWFNEAMQRAFWLSDGATSRVSETAVSTSTGAKVATRERAGMRIRLDALGVSYGAGQLHSLRSTPTRSHPAFGSAKPRSPIHEEQARLDEAWKNARTRRQRIAVVADAQRTFPAPTTTEPPKPKRRLSPAEREDIARSTLSVRKLAAKYGVPKSTVWRIKDRGVSHFAADEN